MEKEEFRSQKEEFAEKLRDYGPRIFAYIHSLVRNIHDTDDLFQQTSLVLWRKFADFDREKSFFSWACGIARLEVANHTRKQANYFKFRDSLQSLLIQSQLEVTDDEMDDRRDALSRCLQKLSKEDQNLLHRCYENEGTITETANLMGRSPHSVYNTLRRIRQALFECIEKSIARDARFEN